MAKNPEHEEEVPLQDEMSSIKNKLKELQQVLEVSKHLKTNDKSQEKPKYTGRMSYKDVPVVQLSGSTVWFQDKEMFDSPTHFIKIIKQELSP